jgi:hypothetical protein
MNGNWTFAMKHPVAVCGSRRRMLLLAALPMGAALLAMPGVVPAADAQACCQVTAVSGKSASAVDTKTKTTFQFTVTKPVSLRVGDAVYANFPKKEVSCDGRSICGTITSIAPLAALTPVTPKIEGTTEGEARTTATIPPKAEPEVPGCRITAIDARTGEVSARETATGRTFTFAVSDARLRNFLKVGQGVHANFDAKEVSLDGKSVVGRIVSLAPPELATANRAPASAPPKEKAPENATPTGGNATATSGSSSGTSSGSSAPAPNAPASTALSKGVQAAAAAAATSVATFKTGSSAASTPPAACVMPNQWPANTQDTYGHEIYTATYTCFAGTCGATATISGNIFPAYSFDWLEFTVPASLAGCPTPIIQAAISSNPPNSLCFDAVVNAIGTPLRDGDTNPVLCRFSSWLTNQGNPNDPLQPGAYYIKVHGAGPPAPGTGASSATGTWTLTINETSLQ